MQMIRLREAAKCSCGATLLYGLSYALSMRIRTAKTWVIVAFTTANANANERCGSASIEVMRRISEEMRTDLHLRNDFLSEFGTCAVQQLRYNNGKVRSVLAALNASGRLSSFPNSRIFENTCL
jgi:hypothetical protein